MIQANSHDIRNLLLRLQAGDGDAFRTIFEIHKKRVFSVAYGIVGNYQQAKEITQDVFIRLFQSNSKINVEKPFFTYLYKITVNASIDFLKQNQSSRFEQIDSEKLGCDQAQNPDVWYEKKEMRSVIHKIANRLSHKQRIVFVLRHLEDLTLDEIQQVLQCSPTTVRTQLHFARNKIRKIIEKEYPEFLKE